MLNDNLFVIWRGNCKTDVSKKDDNSGLDMVTVFGEEERMTMVEEMEE